MPSSKRSRGIRDNVRTLNLRRNLSGIVQNRDESSLTPDQAVDVVNMHSTEEGNWSSDRVGYSVLNASGTAYESGAVIDGMSWWQDPSGSDHLMVAANGKLLEVNVSTGAATTRDASAAYTVGNPVDFLSMYDRVYTVDGSIATPRYWDGSTAGDSAGWPISDGTNTYTTPKYVETFQGRGVFMNFGGGTDSVGSTTWESHFALSDYGNPESFTLPAAPTDGFLAEVGVRDGQVITGGKTIHNPATNQENLIIFKNRSTYQVTGNSALIDDADAFQVIRINGNYGAINNRCIVEVGSDVLAFNRFGITSFTGSTNSGNIQPNPINSDLVKDTIATLNTTAEDQCWAIHLPQRREVWFFMPTGSSTQCDTALVFKYPSPGTNETPKWSRRTAAGGYFLCSIGTQINSTFYIGTYTGFVGVMFNSSMYAGVQGIPWRYEYPYLALGNEKQVKRIVSADSFWRIRTEQGITIETKWQYGGNNNNSVVTKYIGNLGAGVYNTSLYGVGVYTETAEVKLPYTVNGNGCLVKTVLSGTTNDSGPEFLGINLVTMIGTVSQHQN